MQGRDSAPRCRHPQNSNNWLRRLFCASKRTGCHSRVPIPMPRDHLDEGLLLSKLWEQYRHVGDCPVNLIWIRKNMVYLPTSTPRRRSFTAHAYACTPMPLPCGSEAIYTQFTRLPCMFTWFILNSTILSITGLILDRSLVWCACRICLYGIYVYPLSPV